LGRRTVGLLGEDHLSAEALILSTQGTEVDTAGATTSLGVLSVPRQAVVAGLLISIRWSSHELARDIETGRVVSDESGSKHQQGRINSLDALQTRNWGSVPLHPKVKEVINAYGVSTSQYVPYLLV